VPLTRTTSELKENLKKVFKKHFHHLVRDFSKWINIDELKPQKLNQKSTKMRFELQPKEEQEATSLMQQISFKTQEPQRSF